MYGGFNDHSNVLAASITPRLRRFVMKFRLLPRQARQALPDGFNQKLFHRSQQHGNVHRFLHERTHAGVDRREELIRARRDDDDGDERMLPGELLEGVPAIFDGHVQVEQHKINRGLVGQIKRLLSIFSGNDQVAFGLENVVQGIGHGRVVVHQQDAFGVAIR